MHSKHNPLHCIIPPHMYEQIQENGTPAQQEKAVENAQVSAQFRVERIEAEAPPPAPLEGLVTALERRVYTANNGTSLPGTLVRGEGDPPSGDMAVDEAYDGAGETYNLYSEVYQRNSIDDGGMTLNSTVHYRVGYDNAFWNGSQMVYGDGDEDLPENQRLFNRFTIAIDIIGHELAHGVTEYTGDLVYANQPGALNESFSDVFGSLVKQRALGQSAAEADWIIGAGLFTPNVNGVGIRSMKEPGTAYNDPVLGRDPQPGHMDDYVNTISDNGGVHINSGIPNRAFYLTALEIGGFAWEKAGQIWYVTLRDRVQSNTNFQQAASLTYVVAGELYGANSLEQLAVRNGWAAVGLTVADAPPPPPPNGDGPGCLGALMGLFRPAERR